MLGFGKSGHKYINDLLLMVMHLINSHALVLSLLVHKFYTCREHSQLLPGTYLLKFVIFYSNSLQELRKPCVHKPYVHMYVDKYFVYTPIVHMQYA